MKKAKFNSNTIISISPCDLIKCKEGLLIKRGASFLLIKDNRKIQAINYLYFCFSGQHLYGEVFRVFTKEFDNLNLEELLAQLHGSHMIEVIQSQDSFSHEFLDSEKVFFEQLGISIQKIQGLFIKQPVLMVGRHLIFEELKSMMRRYGDSLYRNISYEQALTFDFASEPEEITPSVVIVCSLDGKADMLLELNRVCQKHYLNFLPIMLRDAFCYIGPLTIPSVGPCFECGFKRYNANHKFMSEIYESMLSGVFPLADHAAKYIAAMIFQICIHFVVARNNTNIGAIVEMNINTFSVLQKQILVAPECSVCC